MTDERIKDKNAKDEQRKTKYKRFRNELQRRWRKARNYWIGEKCKEVETLFRIGKVDTAHIKIKENFRERRVDASIVRDKGGKSLTESRGKVNRWVIYIESLYKQKKQSVNLTLNNYR